MKNIKNKPFFRLVSFALSILIIFTVSLSLIISTSADTYWTMADISDLEIGNLSGAPVVDSITSFEFLSTYLRTTSDKAQHTYDYYLPFIVDNGVLYYGNNICNFGYGHSYSDTLNNITLNYGGNAVLNPLTSRQDFSQTSRVDDIHNVVFTVSSDSISYDYANNHYSSGTYSFTSSDGVTLTTDESHTMLYARICTSPKQLRDDEVLSMVDLSSLKYKVTVTGGSSNGRFICFGNYVDYSYDEHLADISTGSIYQRVDYNSHEQAKFTAFMFNDTTCFDWCDSRINEKKITMYSSTSIAFNYYNSSDSVGAVKLRVSKTQMLPSLRQSDNPFDIPNYFTMHPANKHYSRYVIISDGSLRTVPANSTATFRINMQGYCDMNWNSLYLLELVDVQTDTVISSTMFVYTGKDSGKIDGTNQKNGSFISVDYQYEDGNTVDSGDLTPDKDGTLPNLPNGIKDETFLPTGNLDLSNLDVSSIFSSLNQATASVGAFFQATLNIIPVSIMTIILGSLALLIVLRILGR